MGQGLSDATAKAKEAEAKQSLAALEEMANQKLESYRLRAQAAKGSAPKDKDKEIGGGRTFIRVIIVSA